MDWQDAESFKRTTESYQAAMAEVFAIHPKLELAGGHGEAMAPTIWRPLTGRGWRPLAQHITALNCCHSDLFDFSRPKIITSGDRVWCSDFFRVSFTISREFDVYGWRAGVAYQAAWTDEETGEEHFAVPAVPAVIVAGYKRSVTMQAGGFHYALRDWHTKHAEIASICDDLPDALAAKYRIAVVKVANEVARWEEAIVSLQVMPERREVTVP